MTKYLRECITHPVYFQQNQTKMKTLRILSLGGEPRFLYV